MSIHNYKQGVDKSWADLNCDNLQCDQFTVENVVAQSIAVQDLDITNFVLGAVESDNAFVPVFQNQTGALAGALVTKGGYLEKINNLVRCRIIIETTTVAASQGGFQIARADLPIAKSSSFSDTDRCSGTCSAIGGGAIIIGGCAADSPFPSDFVDIQFETLANATLYQLNVEFSYTTD